MLKFLFFRNYWMGLRKRDLHYHWADGGSGHGVSTIFTEISQYGDAEVVTSVRGRL